MYHYIIVTNSPSPLDQALLQLLYFFPFVTNSAAFHSMSAFHQKYLSMQPTRLPEPEPPVKGAQAEEGGGGQSMASPAQWCKGLGTNGIGALLISKSVHRYQ